MILALLWFFPPFEMMYWLLPAHPYAEQMTALLACLFFAQRLASSGRWHHAMLSAFAAALAIWISEFSVIMVGGWALFILFHPPARAVLKTISSHAWILGVCVLAVGLASILWLKTQVPGDPAYVNQAFTNVDGVFQNVETLWFYTRNAMLFQTAVLSSSLILWLHLALFVYLITVRKTIGLTTIAKCFAAGAALSLVVLLLSDWVVINGTPIKYFIPVVVMGWLALLSLNYSRLSPRRVMGASAIAIATTLCQAFNLVHLYRYDIHHGFELSEIQFIQHNRPRHFMGDYWHSYALALADPNTIRATPHDGATQRNSAWTHAVLQADTVFVVCNDWLDAAPDTLRQFDREFLKVSTPHYEGPFRISPYVLIQEKSD